MCNDIQLCSSLTETDLTMYVGEFLFGLLLVILGTYSLKNKQICYRISRFLLWFLPAALVITLVSLKEIELCIIGCQTLRPITIVGPYLFLVLVFSFLYIFYTKDKNFYWQEGWKGIPLFIFFFVLGIPFYLTLLN